MFGVTGITTASSSIACLNPVDDPGPPGPGFCPLLGFVLSFGSATLPGLSPSSDALCHASLIDPVKE